ncbi:MAG: hypothetical protein BA863_16480 [Desulfovibrio sp. S3730MH75]|nr:MAG: hypothetical protein BA863_16480 [Desulfovibrio sp. S3730MH75]
MKLLNSHWFFFLFVILLCIIGGSKMSMAKTLVLGDKPLAESEIQTTLDLYSEEKPMRPNLPPRKLAEAAVSVGKWYIYSLSAAEMSKPSEPTIRQDSPECDFYLVYIPFTLHPSPENKYYQDVKFFIGLANKNATAFDLLPMKVNVEEDVKETYVLSSNFKFQGVEGKAKAEGKAELGYEVQFKNIKPIISAFGQGENKFYWIYQSQKGHKVFPGTRHVFVVLEVPHGIEHISGIIYYEGNMRYKWFKEWRSKETKSDYYPIEWDLSAAKHLHE